MTCEICGNKGFNCDCTREARELHALREEIAAQNEAPSFKERVCETARAGFEIWLGGGNFGKPEALIGLAEQFEAAADAYLKGEK